MVEEAENACRKNLDVIENACAKDRNKITMSLKCGEGL
jgi:hypothetical protein